jgi:hypothetical protein
MSDTQSPAATLNTGAIDPSSGGASHTGAPSSPSGSWHPNQEQRFDPRRKSPILAAVLSMFPGVGQVYIGYYVRGFVIAAIFAFTFVVAAYSREPVGPLLAMGCVFLWIFNIIDAGRMAALYNHAAAGVDTLSMPEDISLPRMGGSIVGGAILLVFGLIALSNTAFGYSLRWLEDWWPLFPLALGLYLFARGVIDYRSTEAPSAAAESPGEGFPPTDA